MDTTEVQRLSIDIYQLADDQLFKDYRTDGSGWSWGWADYEREWMNATPFRNAYRCLPLTIVNQTGWWINNPVGFTATWHGSARPGDISFSFDSPDDNWKLWITSQFGEGIITWNTPFLFRTKPAGSRLLITGPANYFRTNAHPLTALIESDWMSMSFTMNYKIMTPNEPVRFEAGEPLFQAIPLMNNICADLENAEVHFQKLTDDPAMAQEYHDWSTGRTAFHQAKARQEVKPDQWQKDYFQGRDSSGRQVATEHKTKLKPPEILVRSSTRSAMAAVTEDQAMTEPSLPEDRRRPRPAPRRHRPEPRRLAQPTGNLMAPASAGHAPHFRPGAAASSATHAEAPASCPMGFGMMVTPGQSEAKAAVAQPRSAVQSIRSGTTTIRRDQPVHTAAKLDDNHRRWIAENLLLDLPPEMIHEALIGIGHDPDEAAFEIRLALSSPYLRGADQLRNRLKKRDWLLATYRRINRLKPGSETIPRRHQLPRAEFLDQYYSANRPVIITGMMNDWPALRKWNLDFFADNFGNREIEVQFGRNAGENYETEREKYLKTIRFNDFVGMVRTAGTTNDFYLTANNNSSNKSILPELWNDIIQIPEYLDGRDPMNGFFWMGPSGTITPFHHDLTNNFMAQVIGRKKIKIAPSWDMPLMRNDFHVFSKMDGRVTAPQPQPPIEAPQILECILEPGEILFLPIGCLHYVEGMEISVTVSFTNFVFPNDFSSFYTTFHQV